MTGLIIKLTKRLTREKPLHTCAQEIINDAPRSDESANFLYFVDEQVCEELTGQKRLDFAAH